MHDPPRILIVEDQYFVAVDCELHLRAAGFECVGFATTAAEALELAERMHPDLVLMDIQLASRTNGVETALVLYQRLGLRCIFSSAHADTQTRRLAQRAKPLAWLEKPFAGNELVEVVRAGLAQVCAEPTEASSGTGAASNAIH